MTLVFVEQEDGRVSDRSLEALTFARRLTVDSALTALLAGPGAATAAGALSSWKVSTALALDDEPAAAYSPAGWGAALAEAGRTEDAIVATGSDRGSEVLAYAAAMLNQPLATNCVDVTPGEPLRLTRLRWGGSLLEEAALDAPVKILTVAPLAIDPEPVDFETEVSVKVIPPPASPPGARLVERVEPGRGGVRLADARVVVSGGRGVGSAEGFASLEELADLLGAAVGCSRVATSEGWRPHADQVGLTGTRIAPDLYIACGISGAFQHMVGCKGAKHILAVNKDPNAPIMQRADWAIIGDLFEVLPALAAAVRAAKGEPPS